MDVDAIIDLIEETKAREIEKISAAEIAIANDEKFHGHEIRPRTVGRAARRAVRRFAENLISRLEKRAQNEKIFN